MDNENMGTVPSYWNSVIIGAVIIGLIMFIMSIVTQYMTISSEPTGATFTLSQGLGSAVCLIAAIGGFISTRHYAKTFDLKFTLGKGAVIGLLTGIIGVLLSTVMALIWTYLIDPDLNQAVYDWTVANYEAQNMTQEQLEMTLRFTPKPGSMSSLLVGTGVALLTIGILNLISGLVGAKVFASEEEQY